MVERILKLEEEDKMDYTGYYCGYPLLHKKDLDGKEPEIVLCAGNRTGGKTFFWKRLITRYCLKYGKKFLMICRKRTQVNGAAQSFFGDLQHDSTFNGLDFEVDSSGIAGLTGIFIDGRIVGLVTYYSFAESIKEISNMFNDVDIIFKDEFQTRDEYVEDEVGKLRSIHKSISRGFGEMKRFVLAVLCSNQISVVNPYYIALGIHRRIDSKTHFMRGKGWVLEVFFNPEAAHRAMESRFERAFGEDDRALSDNMNVYLDSTAFVGKMNTSKMRLHFVFWIKGKGFGVWGDAKVYYVSRKFDPNFKHQYCVALDSHTEGVSLITRANPIMAHLKRYFDAGFFRFEDVECRVNMMEFFGLAIYL